MVLRWLWDLLEFDFAVVHIKGVNNSMADVLSRYVTNYYGRIIFGKECTMMYKSMSIGV
jgi:hypothetical protein